MFLLPFILALPHLLLLLARAFSCFAPCDPFWFFCTIDFVYSVLMAVAQLKNLQRRLQLLSDEAEQGLNRVCGHELWKSVGPVAVDGVADPDRRAEANYWYGQWNVVRELQEAIG